MKVLRVLGLLLLGVISSIVLVLNPEIGVKAYGAVMWLSVCTLFGVGLAVSLLFAEVFPRGHVNGLHFSYTLSASLMLVSVLVVLMSAVTLITETFTPGNALGRLTALSALVMSSVILHLSVEMFRYGTKPEGSLSPA